MRWNSKNKRRYEQLGYRYTQMHDEFMAAVEDLPSGSNALVEVQCDYCGKEYTKHWDHYLREHHDVCGDACYDCKYQKWAAIHMIDHPDESCPFRSAEANAHRDTTNIERYGTQNVFGNKDIQSNIKETCLRKYGETSYTKTSEYKDRVKQTCMERYGVPYYVMTQRMVGPMNYNWKGGIAIRRNERATYDYQNWRNGVYARDHYYCQCCGQHSGSLVAHHLFNWRDNEDKRYDIDNGVTLCEQCHLLFHSKYGKRFNTPEQFAEFCDLWQKDMLNCREKESAELADKKPRG